MAAPVLVGFRRDLRLADHPALQAALAGIAEAIGPAQVLVNNAARDDRHDWREVTEAYWDERMQNNLRHVFFAIQAVAPDMIAGGGGAVVNIGSSCWHEAGGGFPAYATAKAGVEGLTRTLARDLGPYRIRVNTVVPGWVMTERQRDLWVTPEKVITGKRYKRLLRDLRDAGVRLTMTTCKTKVLGE